MSSSTKYLWVAILYFAQGFPSGAVTRTLPVFMTGAGVDLATIGLISLVGLPWTFKFLWAPLVDRWGSRRHWISASLVGIGALTMLFPSVFSGSVTPAVWALLVAIVVLSATQDIAIDAGTIEMLNEKELGPANGIRVTAFRIALIVAGGFLVTLAAGLGPDSPGMGWPSAWRVAGAIFVGLAVLALFMPRGTRPKIEGVVHEPLARIAVKILVPGAIAFGVWHLIGFLAGDPASASDPGKTLLKYRVPFTVLAGVVVCLFTAFRGATAGEGKSEPLRDLLGRKDAFFIVLFILTFKIGDTAMSPMTTPFLKRGANLPEAEIGILLNTLGMLGTIAGAMLGGYLTSRWGVFRALWILGILQAVSNLGYAWVAGNPGAPMNLAGSAPAFALDSFAAVDRWTGLKLSGLFVVTDRHAWGAALVEAFCGGLGTAPFLAFMMKICNKGEAATQYAFLSAVFVLSGSISGAFSGYFAESMGFSAYFALTFVLAIPAFTLLPVVKRWLGELQGAGSGA